MTYENGFIFQKLFHNYAGNSSKARRVVGCQMNMKISSRLVRIRWKDRNREVKRFKRKLEYLEINNLVIIIIPVMLQMPPFSFMPDFHSSDGISVLHIDIVDNNGERSSLYTAVYVKGKICVTLGFRRFMQSSYHDNYRNFFCPDHSPKIRYRVS